jgi:hypothetical protein
VSFPGRFTSRERDPGTHWIGGWVGPRAILDAVVKRKVPSPRREWNPKVTLFVKSYVVLTFNIPKHSNEIFRSVEL